MMLAGVLAAQGDRTIDEVRAHVDQLRERLRAIAAVTGQRIPPRILFPVAVPLPDSPFPAAVFAAKCERCDALSGVPQTLEEWTTYEKILDDTVAEAIANAPLCSGEHVAIDKGIRSVDGQARWAVDQHTSAAEAAEDVRALAAAVADYEGRIGKLAGDLPGLKAERARLGFPMPAVCDGSEREFRAGLDSVREKIRVLRVRAETNVAQ